MLINTVILFLLDLLPIFILLTYIRAFVCPPLLNRYTLGLGALVSLALILVLFRVSANVSEMLDGAGLEILRASMIMLSYCSLVIGTLLATLQRERLAKRCLFAGIILFTVVKGSAFLIFFDVYLQQTEARYTVLTGIFVGGSICLSFSAIHFFLLQEGYASRLRPLMVLFWWLFLAGLLGHVISPLAQVNVISTDSAVWNTEFLIHDSSEYGHVLKALVGYESTPSLAFLWLYSLAILIPLGLTLLSRLSAAHALLSRLLAHKPEEPL